MGYRLSGPNLNKSALTWRARYTPTTTSALLLSWFFYEGTRTDDGKIAKLFGHLWLCAKQKRGEREREGKESGIRRGEALAVLLFSPSFYCSPSSSSAASIIKWPNWYANAERMRARQKWVVNQLGWWRRTLWKRATAAAAAAAGPWAMVTSPSPGDAAEQERFRQ